MPNLLVTMEKRVKANILFTFGALPAETKRLIMTFLPPDFHKSWYDARTCILGLTGRLDISTLLLSETKMYVWENDYNNYKQFVIKSCPFDHNILISPLVAYYYNRIEALLSRYRPCLWYHDTIPDMYGMMKTKENWFLELRQKMGDIVKMGPTLQWYVCRAVYYNHVIIGAKIACGHCVLEPFVICYTDSYRRHDGRPDGVSYQDVPESKLVTILGMKLFGVFDELFQALTLIIPGNPHLCSS